MVDYNEGQFYSMEGIAAAVLMVLTAYIILSTTSVYTPGDTHIADMQLEQLGNDILKVMDTKNSFNLSGDSKLEQIIGNWTGANCEEFNTTFRPLLDDPRIEFRATVYHRINNDTITIQNVILYENEARPYLGGENAIVASRWVYLKQHTPSSPGGAPNLDSSYYSGHQTTRNETVLLEVLLWRV